MEKLECLRNKIDKIDKKLLNLMIKRFDLIDQVADVKKKNNLPVFVPGREDEILESIASKADPHYNTYVKDLFSRILDVSKRYQIEKMK